MLFLLRRCPLIVAWHAAKGTLHTVGICRQSACAVSQLECRTGSMAGLARVSGLTSRSSSALTEKGDRPLKLRRARWRLSATPGMSSSSIAAYGHRHAALLCSYESCGFGDQPRKFIEMVSILFFFGDFQNCLNSGIQPNNATKQSAVAYDRITGRSAPGTRRRRGASPQRPSRAAPRPGPPAPAPPPPSAAAAAEPRALRPLRL